MMLLSTSQITACTLPLTACRLPHLPCMVVLHLLSHSLLGSYLSHPIGSGCIIQPDELHFGCMALSAAVSGATQHTNHGRTVTALSMSFLCVYRGLSSTMASSCLHAVLNTLPESDAALAVLAEIDSHCSLFEGPAHPSVNPDARVPLDVCLLQLRVLCLATFCSQVACKTMLEQLEGNRPLGDWGTVINVRSSHLHVWCSGTHSDNCHFLQ